MVEMMVDDTNDTSRLSALRYNDERVNADLYHTVSDCICMTSMYGCDHYCVSLTMYDYCRCYYDPLVFLLVMMTLCHMNV